MHEFACVGVRIHKYVHMYICVHREFAYEHVCVNMYPRMNMCAHVGVRVCACAWVNESGSGARHPSTYLDRFTSTSIP